MARTTCVCLPSMSGALPLKGNAPSGIVACVADGNVSAQYISRASRFYHCSLRDVELKESRLLLKATTPHHLNKTVFARVTFDEWKTSLDKQGRVLTSNSMIDNHECAVAIPEGTQQVEFCICARSPDGTEDWDSGKSNANYRVTLHSGTPGRDVASDNHGSAPRHLPPAPKSPRPHASADDMRASRELAKIVRAHGGEMPIMQAFAELYKTAGMEGIVKKDQRRATAFVRLFPVFYDASGLSESTPKVRLAGHRAPRHTPSGASPPSYGDVSHAAPKQYIPPGALPPSPGNVGHLAPRHTAPGASPPSKENGGVNAEERRISFALTQILARNSGRMGLAQAFADLYAQNQDWKATVTAEGTRKSKTFVQCFPDDFDLQPHPTTGALELVARRPTVTPPTTPSRGTSNMHSADGGTLVLKYHQATVTYICCLRQAKAGFEAQLRQAAGAGMPLTVQYNGSIITVTAQKSVHGRLTSCANAFVAQLNDERRVLLGVSGETLDLRARFAHLALHGVGYYIPPKNTVFILKPKPTNAKVAPGMNLKDMLCKHLEADLGIELYRVYEITDVPGFFEVIVQRRSSAGARVTLERHCSPDVPLKMNSGHEFVVERETPARVIFVWPKRDEDANRCMERTRNEVLGLTHVERTIAVPVNARTPLRRSLAALEAQLSADTDVTLRPLAKGMSFLVVSGSIPHVDIAIGKIQREFLDAMVFETINYRKSTPLEHWLRRFLRQKVAMFDGVGDPSGTTSSNTGHISPSGDDDSGVGASDDGSSEDHALTMPHVHYVVVSQAVKVAYLMEYRADGEKFEQYIRSTIETFKPAHVALPHAHGPSKEQIDEALQGIHVCYEVLLPRPAQGGQENGARPSRRQSNTTAQSNTPTLRIFGPEKALKSAIAAARQLLAGHRTESTAVEIDDPVMAHALRLALSTGCMADLKRQLKAQLPRDTIIRIEPIAAHASASVVRLTVPAPLVSQANAAAAAFLKNLEGSLKQAVVPAAAFVQKHVSTSGRALLSKAEADGVAVLSDEQVARMRSHATKAGPMLRVRLSTGLRISVRKCDFQAAGADAVVNPANENLCHGGGLAKAIADAAGDHFVHECLSSVMHHGHIPVGSARATSSGSLTRHGIKHIIHAVAPIYRAETQDVGFAQLQAAAQAALVEAERCGAKRLFMPCIGAGIFDWWASYSADAIVNAILDFAGSGQPYHLEEIILADKDTNAATQLYRRVKKLVDAGSAGSASGLGPVRTAATPSAPPAQRLPEPPAAPTHLWFWGVRPEEDTKFRGRRWMPYDYDQVMQLESAYARNESEFAITGDTGGKASDSVNVPRGRSSAMYVVSFADMKQRNVVSKVERSVKREACGDEKPPLYYQRLDEYQKALACLHAQRSATAAVSASAVTAQIEAPAAVGTPPSNVAASAAGSGLLIIGSANAIDSHRAAIEGFIRDASVVKTLDNVSLSQARLAQLLQQQELTSVLGKFDAKIECNADGQVLLQYIGRNAGQTLELAFHRALTCLPAARVDFPATWKASDGRSYVPVDSASDEATRGLLFDVAADTHEYREVSRDFCGGGFACTIERIQRVQNQALWEAFVHHREHMERYSLPAGANQRRMVHGSRDTDPQVIADTNFDWRFSDTGYYGRGAYFAETMVYSHSYRHKLGDGRSQAFVALVLAGRAQKLDIKDMGLKKPAVGYDSVDGLVASPHRATIVYELRQCYPEYLVTYKK